MAVEQQTLGTSSVLVDVTDTGHGIANPAADLAEADLVEADGKQQAKLSRSSSLGQDPDQIEVSLLMLSKVLLFWESPRHISNNNKSGVTGRGSWQPHR